jgi:protoporphyrinogen oxidase
MKNTSNNIVIAGAGLSGLFVAKYLISKGITDNIFIIEASPAVGGQYGSFEDDELGLLDYGMHVYYDSCIEEIDSLIQSSLPDDEWHILHNNDKDIAGIFFNGKLQKNIPYPDLSGFDIDTQEAMIGSLILSCDQADKDVSNAEDFYINQFGKKITQQIFAPIMLKLHGKELNSLDPLATKLTASSRVSFPSHELMLDFSKSDMLRSKIAFPDQRDLPALRPQNQRALYPKKFGFKNVIDKIKAELEDSGVNFLMENKIEGIKYDESVKSITIKDERTGNTKVVDSIRTLFWGAGMPPLAKHLGISLAGVMPDKRQATHFIYLFLDHPPNMDDLYYFYCFDEGYNSFRVTNYSSYCAGANTGKGYPICIEYWPPENALSDEELIASAQEELVKMGILDDDSQVLHSTIRPGGSPPIPSVANLDSLNQLRESISNKGISNLVLTGMLAGKNTFFIPEVLTDAYTKILKHCP